MDLLNGFIRVEQQYRKWSGGKCKFRLRKRPCQIRWGVTAYFRHVFQRRLKLRNVQFIQFTMTVGTLPFTLRISSA